MKEKILILFFVMIIFSSIVLAYEENYIFIIDEEGNTELKYQTVLTVLPGYYIPGSNATLIIPKEAQNVEFYDNQGKIYPSLLDTKEGYNFYYIITKKVESDKPYEFGYIYNLPKYTTVRYNENYHFEYPIYLDSNIYVCTSPKASSYPIDYDSSPQNDWRKEYTYTKPNLTKIDLPNIDLTILKRIDFSTIFKTGPNPFNICPDGLKENKITNIEMEYLTKPKFDFSIPGKTTEFFTYNGEKVTLIAPKIYQDIIEKNIKTIEKTLPSIETQLNLNVPSKYNLKFVSDTDKVIYENDNAMVSYDDGTVFFKVSIIRSNNDEFIQINLLRGLINSALLNTYTPSSDRNWWTEGALTNMALKIMEDNNLPNSEVQKTMDEARDEFNNLTKDEIIKPIENSEPEDRIIIDSLIVDEIDNTCPDHVIKLNNITKEISELDFSEEKTFDNYLIYNLKEFCSNDISSILNKYGLPYDNVSFVVDKFKVMKEKLDPINIKKGKILELDDSKSKLEGVEYNLKRGKNIDESLTLTNEIESIYENSIKNKVNILKEYSNAEQKVDSIPIIFYLPSRIMAYNLLNKAIIDINKDNFDSAEKNINKSLFWIDNSTILSLIVYIILCAIIWIIYKKYTHHKKSRSNK